MVQSIAKAIAKPVAATRARGECQRDLSRSWPNFLSDRAISSRRTKMVQSLVAKGLLGIVVTGNEESKKCSPTLTTASLILSMVTFTPYHDVVLVEPRNLQGKVRVSKNSRGTYWNINGYEDICRGKHMFNLIACGLISCYPPRSVSKIIGHPHNNNNKKYIYI